ncbi:hypothetical protein D3879_14645 [Pseudomonas cavernicola]|uniref:HK97 gp10 family phage protein n=1 Tax=Pseudomonas cavernicola TaxID=2320866 RepID=A0A418XEH1_9PSED|nr:hypothetical protein [Pseudomonas cavernicola]RJG10916.1 hypothetical protein D3879_14645 [Pseudomonas cavernicola]
MSFSLDLTKFIEKAKANTELVVQKVAIDMLSAVVDRSPVGNAELWLDPSAGEGYIGGRFRGNWQVSFNVAATGALDRIDPQGSSIKQAGVTFIQAYTSEIGSIWMMNNVPYAQRLEYGHSSQAPNGMVRLTVTEFQIFVNKAVQELPD